MAKTTIPQEFTLPQIFNRIFDKDGNFIAVQDSSEYSAFGELITAEVTPVVQVQFPYNINSRIIETRDNNGTASWDEGRAKVSTGASANQGCVILTKDAAQYNPGQGMSIRFTTIYTTGVADSFQMHGVGDESDGFFFGYDGADFGVLRRYGGKPEVRTLTVTTASTTDEDLTITTDGDVQATVTVTNSNNKTVTANEIAAADYSNVGSGWRTFVNGDTVIFVSYDTAVHIESYSLSGATTAEGSFVQTIVSVPAIDTWIPQTTWNRDRMDGSGKTNDRANNPSQILLDKTQGNVYQIRYQWLGFGLVSFFIENPESGRFVLVHEIEYSNNNVLPSLQNPTLPICMAVENNANTSDLSVLSASMGAFVEGRVIEIFPVENSFTVKGSDIDEVTNQPVATLRNDIVYQSRENRTRIKIKSVEVSNSGGDKPVEVNFTTNATLTGPSFTNIDTETSIASTDESAVAIASGENPFSITLNSSDKQLVSLSAEQSILSPGETFTVSAQQNAPGQNALINVSINWAELF